MTHALPPGFDDSWQDFIDGDLDAEQATALDAMLRSDPAFVGHAADRYLDHRLLTLALQRETADRFVTATLARLGEEEQSFSRRVQQRLTTLQTTPMSPKPWDFVGPTIIGVAAMLAVAVIAAIMSWRPGSAPTTESSTMTASALPAPVQVATLVLADHCVWTHAPQVSGQRLTTGLMELTSGMALVHFDGGAEMLMTGPVAVRLESGGSAWCGQGTVTVRAAQHAAGFIVRTPVAQITDLGTEFCLSIAASGVTDVQVLEGGVEWRNNAAAASDPGAILHQGQALRVRSPDDRTGDALAMKAVRLEALLAQAQHQDRPLDRTPDQHPLPITHLDATPHPGSADLISYDNFRYPFTRTTSVRHEATGGWGWRSPWYRTQMANELPIDLASDSLAMPHGLLPATGGSLELPSEPERPDTYREACMRLFEKPIQLAQQEVRYVSLLVRRSPSVAGPTHYWFRCMLTSETVPNDRLGFGLTSTGCPQLMSHFGNSQSYVPLVDGQSYLMVFKLVASPSAPAQTFLMVYGQHEDVDRHEPSTWMVVGVPGRFTGVLGSIHINNGTERAYTVGELRIGTTWQAVTPRR